MEAKRVHGDLWRLLERDPDAVLELAFDYAAAGRIGETIDVLDEAVRRGATYPMLHYALGYFCGMRKNDPRAAKGYDLGAKVDAAYVFPHRVEEIAILRAAVEKNPQDGRAFYYLGNVLASKERIPEALEAWRAAVRLDPRNGVAHRNLALALAKLGEKEQAIAEYKRAIQAVPEDFHLYLELGEILPADRAVELFGGSPENVRSRSSIVEAWAAALVESGRYSDAASLLEKTQFVSGEGEKSVLETFRKAHLGLARDQQQRGRHAEAAAEFVLATEYPRNLGVGRPAMESQAREYVAAAREWEAAGRVREAQALWRRAAEGPLKSPTEPGEPWSENYYYKAVALEHVKRESEAHALYVRLAGLSDDKEMLAEEADPPLGAIRYELAGLGLKALGHTEQARAALSRALTMDPQNDLAKSALQELSSR